MEGKPILSPPVLASPALDIGRAYSVSDAAAILGITPYVLNERVRQGWIKPLFDTGDRRYSGYALAQLLGWPVAEMMFRGNPSGGLSATGLRSRSRRRGRLVCRALRLTP